MLGSRLPRIVVALVLLAVLTVPPPADAEEQHGSLRPVSLNGFGNPNNYGFHRIYQFQGYLWVPAGNRAQGAIIYRSRDGKHWTAVNRPGFGDRANDAIVTLAWFRGAHDPPGSTGKLYAATFCFRCRGGASAQDGGDIWRANADAKDPKNIVWEKITTNGFGRPDITAFVGFVVHKGRLYAGTFASGFPKGIYVLRTATGDPRDWHDVAPRGFGDPVCNTDLHINIVYGEHAYFGTEEAGCIGVKGGEIWRTDGSVKDGQTTLDGWEKVTVVPGFGKGTNNNIYGMDVFKGHLYAGTWSWGGPGTEVWRAPVVPPHTGVTPVPFAFEPVNIPGYGDPHNAVSLGLAHLGDTLYAIGADLAGGGNGFFMRTSGGTDAVGHSLNWQPITAPGFPPPSGGVLSLDGIYHLEPFKGKLYLVLERGGSDGRGQLWAYTPRRVPVLKVRSVSPCAVPAGRITIRGTGFDDYQGWKNYAVMNGSPLRTVKWTDKEIVAQLPRSAGSGDVAVYRDGETSNRRSVKIQSTCGR
jgi:hypothetical protein